MENNGKFRQLLEEHPSVLGVIIFFFFAGGGILASTGKTNDTFDWTTFMDSLNIGTWVITAGVLLLGFSAIIRSVADTMKENRYKK
jgi:hypothetical protein